MVEFTYLMDKPITGWKEKRKIIEKTYQVNYSKVEERIKSATEL